MIVKASSNEVRAKVREVDGQLVLEDPDAVAMARVVAKHNCRGLLDANAERVAHYRVRAHDLGKRSSEVVVTLLNVDDPHGGPIAEALMPGFDWQPIRDRGELPMARGLAGRVGITEILGQFDPEAAAELQGYAGERVAVVVVDHGVAAVFTG